MMARLDTPGLGRSTRLSAENDIYTALMVVAFLFVLAAAIYVGYRAQVLFGTLVPLPGS